MAAWELNCSIPMLAALDRMIVAPDPLIMVLPEEYDPTVSAPLKVAVVPASAPVSVPSPNGRNDTLAK